MKTASILGILGGLITLIVGAAAYAGMILPSYALFTIGSAALASAVVGILLIVFAGMLDKHKVMGPLLLIFSLIGLVIGAGIVVGPVLALIASLMTAKAMMSASKK